MSWLWISVLIFASLLLLLRQNLRRKKKLPPGPVGLPILGHFHLLGNNPHQDLCNLARKYGPIMYLRLGLVPTVVVSSPAAAELVLKTHDLVFASRPHHEGSKYVGYGQTNITFGRYGSYWRNMRKLCTLELLSNLRISQFRPTRKAELGLLVDSLKSAAQMGETVDFSERVSGLSADIVCLMVFGRKYSAEKEFDEKGFKSIVTTTLEVGGKFNLGDYFPYMGVIDLQGLTRQMKQLSKVFDAFFENIIEEHVNNKKDKNITLDFVDTMLSIMESQDSEFIFDRRHMKAVLLDMFVAGMDTSSTAVDWAVSELIRHPHIMKKLQEEIASVVGLDNMVDESHIESFPYLDMVIKETLRLHPVAPLLLPHESLEDCVIDGFFVPKKSRIIVNTWAIGRDPNTWPDPEIFNPERFSGNNVDIRGRDFRLLPFGSGRRMCPGLQLGLTMFRLMLAQLVHCFDWKLPNGMLPEDVDMTEHFGLVTARENHVFAIPTYRLSQ